MSAGKVIGVLGSAAVGMAAGTAALMLTTAQPGSGGAPALDGLGLPVQAPAAQATPTASGRPADAGAQRPATTPAPANGGGSD